ncbi:MAG: FAD:protein FMN transferase [Sediminibacterium sp.]
MKKPLLFLLFFTQVCMSAAQQNRYAYSMQKMGSPFNIVLYADTKQMADSAAQESFKLVDSINLVCSDYDSTSELYKLRYAAVGIPIKVSPILFELIYIANKAYKDADGSFDITVGPLSRLWRSARRSQQFPTHAAINEARNRVGSNKVQIDSGAQTITFLHPNMQLDMGAIAKGYAADKVLALLQSHGITTALVDAGGDMVAFGMPPQKKGWTIGINVPGQQEKLLERKLVLSNKAVATSGDAFQFMLHEGKKYGHIIDPRTGYGVTFQRNVTVVAPTATTADWLATACSILTLEQVKILAEKYKSEVLITTLQNGRIHKVIFGKFGGYLAQ